MCVYGIYLETNKDSTRFNLTSQSFTLYKYSLITNDLTQHSYPITHKAYLEW